MNATCDVFAVAGSGTLAKKMGIADIIESGDKVLIVSKGYFGDRFADAVSRDTSNVKTYAVEWGKVPDSLVLREKLTKGGSRPLL